MNEFRNIKQLIEDLEGITGIKQRPEYLNDQQYVDYLQDKFSNMSTEKSVVKTKSKTTKKVK